MSPNASWPGDASAAHSLGVATVGGVLVEGVGGEGDAGVTEFVRSGRWEADGVGGAAEGGVHLLRAR